MEMFGGECLKNQSHYLYTGMILIEKENSRQIQFTQQLFTIVWNVVRIMDEKDIYQESSEGNKKCMIENQR